MKREENMSKKIESNVDQVTYQPELDVTMYFMESNIDQVIHQVTYQPELDVTMYFMEMDECEDEENLEIDLDGGLSAINE